MGHGVINRWRSNETGDYLTKNLLLGKKESAIEFESEEDANKFLSDNGVSTDEFTLEKTEIE